MRPYMQPAPKPEPVTPVLSPHPGDCQRHPLRLRESCPECRQEADLLRAAAELVSKRLNERSMRIEVALKPYAAQIARDKAAIEQRLAAEYLALQATQIRVWNEAQAPYEDKVSGEVYEQMLAEALAELRSQDGASA